MNLKQILLLVSLLGTTVFAFGSETYNQVLTDVEAIVQMEGSHNPSTCASLDVLRLKIADILYNKVCTSKSEAEDQACFEQTELLNPVEARNVGRISKSLVEFNKKPCALRNSDEVKALIGKIANVGRHE
jgi:hypothetical protein